MNPDEVTMYINKERAAMPEKDQSGMVVSIKADAKTKMGIVSDVKQALRRAAALNVNYTSKKPTK